MIQNKRFFYTAPLLLGGIALQPAHAARME